MLIKLTLLVLLVTSLAGCSLNPFGDDEGDPAPAATGPSSPGASGIAAVAGIWEFAHCGPPSISNSADIDPVELAEQQLRGAMLSIGADGNASFVAAGNTATFKAAVTEETDLYIKIDAAEQPSDNPYVYNKATRLLAMNMPLDVDGSKGSMPAYFRRKN